MKTEKGYQRGRGRGTQGGGEVRIIGGALRGQRVPVAPRPGLRPTPGRSRETLFNWLREDLQDARVLDVFAGSGALGLEALSRGAAAVTFIEKDRRAALVLRTTLERLGGERTALLERDALTVLEKPPFPSPLTWCSSTPPLLPLAQAALTPGHGALLAPGAKVSRRMPKGTELTYPRLRSPTPNPGGGKCCPAGALEAPPSDPGGGGSAFVTPNNGLACGASKGGFRMRTVVYPGTFNPITVGHTDLVKRALKLDRVIVAIGTSPQKNPEVDLADRIALCREVLADIPGVEVDGFNESSWTMSAVRRQALFSAASAPSPTSNTNSRWWT